MNFLKLTNLVILLAATAWLTKQTEWEAFITFFVALSTLIMQEVNQERKAKKNDRSARHDKDLFVKYDNCLPESELLYELNNDLYNLTTDYDFMNKVDKYLKTATTIEGNFIDKKTDKAFKKWITKLEKLKSFVATHFFTPLEGATKDSGILMLYPEQKYEGDEEKRGIYAKRSEEINEIIGKVIEQYTHFRETIKKQHYI